MATNNIKDKAAETLSPGNHQHNTSCTYPNGQISFGKIPVFIFYENPELKPECQANYETEPGQLDNTKRGIKRKALL